MFINERMSFRSKSQQSCLHGGGWEEGQEQQRQYLKKKLEKEEGKMAMYDVPLTTSL